MDKLLEKAGTLIEALPYIQAFNKKIVVVKYGGSAMLDENLKKKAMCNPTVSNRHPVYSVFYRIHTI